MDTRRSQILDDLKSRIGADLEPVRPLASPVRRALAYFPVWGLLVVFVLAVFGFRADYGQVGPVALWSLTLFQAGFAIASLWLALRFVIPGELLSSGSTALGAGAGVLAHLAVSAVFYNLSPLSLPPELFIRVNLICLSMVLALGLIPFLVGAYLARRGVLMYPLLTGALLGLGSGLGAESAWRMHCPVSSWDHVLLSHTFGIGVAVLVGILAGRFLRHRRVSPDTSG